LHLLGLVAPPACPACGAPASRQAWAGLCRVCRPRFPTWPICRCCGRWLPPHPLFAIHPVWKCRACRPLRPRFDRARAVAPYAGSWRLAVLAFKRRPGGNLGWQLVGLIRRLVLKHFGPDRWDGIVPVPSRGRGDVHPARVLAQCLAKRLELRCHSCLRFTRPTRPQHCLPREERLRNLRGSLAACGQARAGRWLLVDDVYTTGATVHECSRALKQAGAAGVDVVTLARREDRRWPMVHPLPPATPGGAGIE
jgi:predicted amidophosphoribosyltransferase